MSVLHDAETSSIGFEQNQRFHSSRMICINITLLTITSQQKCLLICENKYALEPGRAHPCEVNNFKKYTLHIKTAREGFAQINQITSA